MNPICIITDDTRVALAVNQSERFENRNIRAALVTEEMLEGWFASDHASVVIVTSKQGAFLCVPVYTERFEMGTNTLLPEVIDEIAARGSKKAS